MDLSVLGGKYYLDSDAASFQGRVDAFFSPVIKFSDSHEFVPVYSGNYSGTQDIQELVGGGVLTRQRQSQTLSFKYVYTSEFNKYKTRYSSSKALVKETKDEKWNKGLFDYKTMSFGFEAEQERPRGTYSEAYDFYQVKYPNYATLLSQSDTVIDTTTFNELSANAGTNTMDNTSHRVSFGYTWFPEPLVMNASYDFTYRAYGDQALVANPATGQSPFTSGKRHDLVHSLALKISRDMKPLRLSLNSSASWLNSNQNSYDSSRTKYIKDYYSYIELGLSPAINFNLKDGAQFGLGVDWKRLYYLGRLKQNEGGNYGASKINQTIWLSSLFIRYPLTSNFFIRASYNYQVSSSNMRYEANYRYNYRSNTYLAGVEWEF
ncbi:MAG TPA: hypothetical protein DCL44_09985 [Elusimicrobia bacterium]|nr:hypothetical protein [Elusimicrobiota bacterium]